MCNPGTTLTYKGYIKMANEETMLQKIDTTEMATWNDDKRKEFVETFDERAIVSETILIGTASEIINIGTRRRFISAKHVNKVGRAPEITYPGNSNRYGNVGGRSYQELQEVAVTNAKGILRALPPLKKAVQILDADTAKMIDAKEKMEKVGQKLTDKLKEVSSDLDLDDLDQKMTIAAFRKMVKARNKMRNDLIYKLDTLGEELSEVDTKIAKKLYAGLPGLSDAIVKAIVDCYDRVKMLEQMRRRVKEQVMFGDSEAALEILRSFEKDEQELSSDVKEEFKKAMNVLKAAGKKAVKKLKAK